MTWEEVDDPDFGLDEEALKKKKSPKKGFMVKAVEDPYERAQREREEEERERAERAEAKRRAGPTFFGGGRLGNALDVVDVMAAARNGENWSKRNAIVVNSDKRREAQLRALAAAETRRLGSRHTFSQVLPMVVMFTRALTFENLSAAAASLTSSGQLPCSRSSPTGACR